MELKDLEVYQISRDLSSTGWDIYSRMKSEYRFAIGQQFLRAIDSIGANLSEG